MQGAGDLDGLSYRLLFVALGRFKTGTNMLLEGALEPDKAERNAGEEETDAREDMSPWIVDTVDETAL